MKPTTLLPSAYLLDSIAGDPEWFPHPVRVIGIAIDRGETLLRRPMQSDAAAFIAGAALTIGIVTTTYSCVDYAIKLSRRQSIFLGDVVELLCGWTCVAARNLEQEATSVIDLLIAGDLPQARMRLSRIVGRDTEDLSAEEISRAVIETLAESASDGIIAPLFYMALGGAPLAMAYKAVNTLDSMIGHADQRYFYFGKFAARLDDVANFLPSRLTAAGIVVCSHLLRDYDSEAASRIWRRDGAKHKSTNAGQPESAMAGALAVRLGGENTYDGEAISAPYLGADLPSPEPKDAVRAMRLISALSLLGVAAGVLLATCMRTKRTR